MARNALITSVLRLTQEICAFLCKKACGNPVLCVILQCIQGVSAWESPSDAWENVSYILKAENGAFICMFRKK
jgi:hypothetical protein